MAAAIALVATVVYIQAQIVAGGLIANVAFGLPRETGLISALNAHLLILIALIVLALVSNLWLSRRTQS